MAAAEARRRRRWVLRGLAFAVLLGLVFVLGSINVPFLEPEEPSEVILLYVFSGIVFLAFVIYGLVLIRYLARLYTERRQQVLGTKFKTKMVAGALALSLLPVIALFFLSYAMLNRTLAKWFPRPLEIVRDDAVFIVGCRRCFRPPANSEISLGTPPTAMGSGGRHPRPAPGRLPPARQCG